MREAAHGVTVAPMTQADVRDELWLEVGRTRGHAPPAALVLANHPPKTPPADIRLPLPELLALDGMAFVEAAYRTVLARAPDETGAAHLMQQMAAGRSKIMLLGQLQRSQEGALAGRTLPGLHRRYIIHRIYRVPVLGGVVRLASAVLRRTGVSRRMAGGDAFAQATRGMSRGAVLSMLGTAQEAAGKRASDQQASIDAMARHLEMLQLAHERVVRTAADAHAETVAHRRQSGEAETARERLMEATIQRLDATMQRLGAQERAAEATTQRLDAQARAAGSTAEALAAQGRSLDTLTAQVAGHGRRIGAAEDSTIEALLSLSDTLADQDARLLRVEQRPGGDDAASQTGEAARIGLDDRLQRLESIAAQNRHDLAHHQRRVGLLLESQPGTANAAVLPEDPPTAIAEQREIYLPLLAETQAGGPDRPILDLGSGQGGFLDMLRGEGLAASGLEGTAADAIEHLARQAAGSLGAVVALHLIEHLPFKAVMRLIDEAQRALAPGGVLILETPNPANLLVASRWFYLDPTHRNPLPSDMLSTLIDGRGFDRISIIDLHPLERTADAPFNPLFHGPQDYALLARKP